MRLLRKIEIISVKRGYVYRDCPIYKTIVNNTYSECLMQFKHINVIDSKSNSVEKPWHPVSWPANRNVLLAKC